MMESTGNEFAKQVLAAAASAILTFGFASFVRNFLFAYPLAGIFVLLIAVPLLVIPYRLSRPLLWAHFRKYWLAMVVGCAGALAVLSLTRYFVLAALLLVHAFMSATFGILKRNHIGINMVTFITVISAVAYGAGIGAVVGASAMVMDYVFSRRLSIFSIVTVPAYALVGLIAASFASANLFLLGIALVVFYNLFTWIFILGFMGGHIGKCIRFGLTDLGFNAVLFSYFGSFVLAMMV